ncbi:MAG: PIN domain-containing protein [Chloroflexi bacterium]|nr:PIN domain-containing protein [Chloroflexota bacterium]
MASDLAHQAVERLLRLEALRIVALDRRLGLAASQLAAELGLRGADATYVAVANQLRIPLVSWDREQLERASERVSVATPETSK